MRRNCDKIEEMYDTIADRWAEAFPDEHEKKPKDREILQRFVREIGSDRPVWDFGCGPGNTSAFLKKIGLDVSGLDLSRQMLEQAGVMHPGIRFQRGDMLDLEFEKDSIAGVVAFYAIVHFSEEQVRTAFREIVRVLRPGGLFLFAFHLGEGRIRLDEFLGRKIDIDFMFFTTDFILGCLKDSGFEKIEIIERDPYPGVEYPSRRAYVFARKPVAG